MERAGDLTRELLVDYQAALFTDTTSQGRPLALRTQAHRLQTLLGFLRYLVGQGVLLVNPGEGIELPKFGPRRPPRNVPTEAEVEALLAAPDPTSVLGIRDRAMLEVLYSTGLRVGELVRLKVYDVNLTDGRVQVIAGKGGRDRVVPLGRVATRAVQAYLEKLRPRLVGSRSTATLFVSVRGGKLWPTAVQTVVRQYARQAGIRRPITPHSLRHACATHMLRGRASIRHIQELLGHRQLSTTQLYTQVEIEDLKAVHQRTHPRERLARARKKSGRSRSTGSPDQG